MGSTGRANGKAERGRNSLKVVESLLKVIELVRKVERAKSEEVFVTQDVRRAHTQWDMDDGG